MGEWTFSLETVGQEGNPHTLGWEESDMMRAADSWQEQDSLEVHLRWNLMGLLLRVGVLWKEPSSKPRGLNVTKGIGCPLHRPHSEGRAHG